MVTRRDALNLIAGGVLGVVTVGCTSPSSNNDSLVLDSFYDSGTGRQAMADAISALGRSQSVSIGTTAPGAFAQSLDGYLNLESGAAFTWTAGAELSALIAGGRLTHVSQAWESGDLNPRFRRMASDSDGVPYFVPFVYDPWAVYYSRTQFADNGYQIPNDVDSLLELVRKLTSDGSAAFGLQRLSEPATVALFDYISLATNGVGAHRDFVGGGLKATSPEFESVIAVLGTIAEVERVLGVDAPVALVPSLISDAVTRDNSSGDIGLFNITPDAVVANIDGICVAPIAAGQTSDGAVLLARDLGQAVAQEAFLTQEPGGLPASPNATFSNLGDLELAVVELVDQSSDVLPSVASGPDGFASSVISAVAAIMEQ